MANLIGERFDKLLVTGYKAGNGKSRSLRICLCDCGNTCEKTDKYLKNNIRRSCGCHLQQLTKVCVDCGIEKDKSEYHACARKKIGVQSRCKDCQTEYKKKRYWTNRDEELIKLSKSRNKPENVLQRKNYYELNKKKYAERYQKYMTDEKKKEAKKLLNKVYQKTSTYKNKNNQRVKQRRLTDMEFALKSRLCRRIRSLVICLSKGKSVTKSLTSEYLGCDLSFFKSYFENLFTDGMSWERISEIHIDHKKPCARFDLSNPDQVKLCFHYSNLQPMWALDNILKSDKYDGD